MRPNPESTARAIAPRRRARTTNADPTLFQRMRAPEGAVVTEFPIERAKNGRKGARGDNLTAAAQVITRNRGKSINKKVKRAPTEAWQVEAWNLRDETGELRFIGDRQARAASQVRMFIGQKPTPDSQPAPVGDGPIAQLSEALFGNAAEVAQEIRRGAQQEVFNGETNILIKELGNNKFSWTVHSSDEITGSEGAYKLTDGQTTRNIDEATELIIRAWNPHPRYRSKADAPVRAILPVARELKALTQYVSAQVDSRLAGSGLLLLPQGIEQSWKPPEDAPDDYTILDEFTDYMTIPLTDRGSAGSVVPYMMLVDPTLIDKIKHIRFDSKLDAEAPKLRDESIRRIALGMDSDPMVLLGMQGGNHWSAWAVSEDEVRLGVSPLVTTLCHALTVGFLQPMLEDAGIADHHTYQVWFDTTPLELRPDRSKDAQDLFNKGELKGESLRRENGFDEDDAPGDDERKNNLLERLVIGAPTLAPIILPKLGIDFEQQVLNDAAQIKETVDGNGQSAPAGPKTSPAPDAANSPPDTGGDPAPSDTEDGSAPA